MKLVLMLFVCCLCLIPISGRATLSDQEISEFGGCYFAPMTSARLWRMRTQDGAIREFEPDRRHADRLVGVGGWWGQLTKEGVTIHSPATDKLPALAYNFVKGRLDSLDVLGRHCRFGYPNPLVYEGEEIAPLWPDVEAMTAEQFAEETDMWKGGERLRLWFPGPNQAGLFCAFFVLIFLALVLYSRRLPLRIFFGAFSLAALVLVAMSASRGAFVALAAGSILIGVSFAHVRGLLNWRNFALGLVILLLVGSSFLSVGYFKARSRSGDQASDAQRIEVMTGALAMLSDAPYGWGARTEIGKAYSDWYQPLTDSRIRLNLISDHATILVSLGWGRGFLYLALWSVGLLVLFASAWRGGSPIPVAVWTALGIAAAFNVVLFAKYILWVPYVTLAIFVFDRRWLNYRCWLWPTVVGAILAGIGIGGLFVAAKIVPRQTLTFRHVDGQTIVNGRSASAWLVAEPEVLGLTTTAREIRNFYRRVPSAPSLGYVEDLSDLPQKGVRRLILTGDAGLSFLETFKRGGIPIDMPMEIVFLSSGFPPSDIPLELRAKANVSYVIGEFAARYHADLADPPKWCTIVPGAEIYIPGWMRFCVN